MAMYDYADDDYIDMELTSSFSTPPPCRDFEFHNISSFTLQKEPSSSPADELFYKGKLLPLHLPPRIQMVEKLLQTSSSIDNNNTNFQEYYSTPLMSTPTTSTPYESCNISPSDSCQVSRELNPQEYFFFSDQVIMNDHDFANGENSNKSSWTRKLKLSSRLKASRTYFKSLFGKSASVSDDSYKIRDQPDPVFKPKEALNKPVKKTPFGQIQKEKINGGDGSCRLHRRSFSMALKRHSIIKTSTSSSSSSSSSSTSSNNGNGYYGLPFLKRSSSVNSEIENPIQGAIAHCKQSFCSRKSVTEVGFYSLSASRIGIFDDQERPELCRG